MKLARVALGMAAVVTTIGCNGLFQTAGRVAAPGMLDVQAGEPIDALKLPKGKGKLLGRALLPSRLVTKGRSTQALQQAGADGARIEVLDGNLQPTGLSTTTDVDGFFELDGVPLGQASLIKVTRLADGKTATLSKITRPERPLQCVKVDVASTMVADKILSEAPLFRRDPALEGVPLLELVIGERLDRFEEAIRTGLEPDEQAELKIIEAITSDQPIADDVLEDVIADLIAEGRPEIAEELEDGYHSIFERPTAGLGIRIAAVGINKNERRRQKINGVFKMVLQEVKEGTCAVEYWFSVPIRQQIGSANQANGWSVVIDTWDFANGEYTMEAILKACAGRKRVLGRVNLEIDNSPGGHCK